MCGLRLISHTVLLFQRDSDGVHFPILFTNTANNSNKELLHVFEDRFAAVLVDEQTRDYTLRSSLDLIRALMVCIVSIY